MNLHHKLTAAKTSTLIALAFILSAWLALIPWISIAINDLSNWLFSTAVLISPHGLEGRKIFDLLLNIYSVWWDIGFLFFCVLTVAQGIIASLMSFHLLRVLYRRWEAGTAKMWQFLVSGALIVLAMVFTLTSLSIAYVDSRSWWLEQVYIVNDTGAFDGIPEDTPFS